MTQLFLHIIFNIFISIIVLYTTHSIWEHMKNIYSVKKTKDLASIQSLKFQQMMDNINTTNNISISNTLQQDDIEKLNADLEQYISAQVDEI